MEPPFQTSMWKTVKTKLKTVNLPWGKAYKGSDLIGNMYFEAPSTAIGLSKKRTIEYSDGRNHISQYDPDTIPIEWQSWMRHTRKDPPTITELLTNISNQKQVQERVEELKIKESDVMINKPH